MSRTAMRDRRTSHVGVGTHAQMFKDLMDWGMSPKEIADSIELKQLTGAMWGALLSGKPLLPSRAARLEVVWNERRARFVRRDQS